jgi:hypothetical protein
MGKRRRVGPRLVGVCQHGEEDANTRAATQRGASRTTGVFGRRPHSARLCRRTTSVWFRRRKHAGPALIPQRYFWRTEEIDWNRETITSLGKKFYHVRVQGEREPEDEWTMAPEPIDPRLIHRESESADETLPGLSERSSILAQTKPETADGERHKPRMGRPPLLPEVRKVVRDLIDRHAFANLSKKQMETLIRSVAKERSPASFPKSEQPSKNTINKALILEGWPPAPLK